MTLGSSQNSRIRLELKGRCRTCDGSGRDRPSDTSMGSVSNQLACFVCLGHGVEIHDLIVGDLCIERSSKHPFLYLYLGRADDSHWFLRADVVSDKIAKCFGSHLVRSSFMIVSRFEEARDA